MKPAFIALFFLAACGTPDTKTTMTTTTTPDTTAPAATPASPAADAAAGQPGAVAPVLTHYLHIKNALAADNGKEAATAGTELLTALSAVDVATIKADQQKTFADIREDAKEHATHISQNGGNIKHQREHFQMLSKDMYDLARNIGAGQTLYYDHCPMYNNGKGGNWLSESKTISNPYLGKAMPDCGEVKETLK